MISMKAAVLHGKKDLRYEDVQKPEIDDNSVLLKVRACGICGSDLPRVLGDAANFYPIILGHEFSGEVVEVGINVSKVKIGDRATCAPLIPCFKCMDCLRGNYSLCKKYTFIGSRIQGGFAEYVKLPETSVVKFDSNISFEKGAFFEPATVALHGIRKAEYIGGKNVAIIGSGVIGIFVMQFAQILGAKNVFVFDNNESMLNVAKKMGADFTYNTKSDFKAEIHKLTKGEGFDYVFEAAGAFETIKLAFDIAGNRSHLCLIGTPKTDGLFTVKEFEMIHRKELNIVGSWMSYSTKFPGEEWDLVMHYFANNKLQICDDLIFAKYPLSRANEAFNLYETSKVNGKILLIND